MNGVGSSYVFELQATFLYSVVKKIAFSSGSFVSIEWFLFYFAMVGVVGLLSVFVLHFCNCGVVWWRKGQAVPMGGKFFSWGGWKKY